MDILIVDDEKIIRDAATLLVEAQGHYAEAADSRGMALEALRGTTYDLVLLDVNLGADNGLEVLAEIQKKYPMLAVVVFTAAATVKVAVEAMRLGALDFLEKPFTASQLSIVLSRVQKHRQMATRVIDLQTQVATHTPEPVFQSGSVGMQSVLDVLFRAATTSASVLILGESGTGKSVIARAVHQRSQRADRTFVTVNCPSLSKELLESELFGHVRGSFTGAMKDHWGKVKAAEGGTLFLDEIGELPLEIQPKLLRLLQDREYERLGENSTRSADVRVIAATNRDLAKEVVEGRFREDLFYRLNVITVEMPPLRERAQDLLHFSEQYMRFFASQCGRKLTGFDERAKNLLMAHHWPGNLRELRNAIERAVTLAQGTQLTPDDLPVSMSRHTGEPKQTLSLGDPVSLETIEAAHIRALLPRAGNLSEAAEILGIDQTTLYRKRKKLGLAAEA